MFLYIAQAVSSEGFVRNIASTLYQIVLYLTNPGLSFSNFFFCCVFFGERGIWQGASFHVNIFSFQNLKMYQFELSTITHFWYASKCNQIFNHLYIEISELNLSFSWKELRVNIQGVFAGWHQLKHLLASGPPSGIGSTTIYYSKLSESQCYTGQKPLGAKWQSMVHIVILEARNKYWCEIKSGPVLLVLLAPAWKIRLFIWYSSLNYIAS